MSLSKEFLLKKVPSKIRSRTSRSVTVAGKLVGRNTQEQQDYIINEYMPLYLKDHLGVKQKEVEKLFEIKEKDTKPRAFKKAPSVGKKKGYQNHLLTKRNLIILKKVSEFLDENPEKAQNFNLEIPVDWRELYDEISAHAFIQTAVHSGMKVSQADKFYEERVLGRTYA